MGYIAFLLLLCYNYDISHIRSYKMYCMLFGHADAPDSLKSKLEQEILIFSEKNVNVTFLIGNNGNFDFLAQSTLETLCRKGKNIDYTIVLSRIDEAPLNRRSERTIFPEELSGVLPKYAISKRNEWIIRRSNFAICYVSRIASNSSKMLSKLQRRNVKTINLIP